MTTEKGNDTLPSNGDITYVLKELCHSEENWPKSLTVTTPRSIIQQQNILFSTTDFHVTPFNVFCWIIVYIVSKALYHLLAEFGVRTVSYGSSFMRAWAINRAEKTRIRNLIQCAPRTRG